MLWFDPFSFSRILQNRFLLHAMSESKITTADDVYHFVERLKSESEKHGASALAAEFGDALHLGSSGLEIFGGIRQTIIANRPTIERLLGPSGSEEAEQVIAFVDGAFGR